MSELIKVGILRVDTGEAGVRKRRIIWTYFTPDPDTHNRQKLPIPLDDITPVVVLGSQDIMREPLIELTRSGLFCPKGDFYIDPMKRVPIALITHAHSDHARPGHGQYLCARDSVPLLRIRLGSRIKLEGLVYGVRKRIGSVWVSFHSAGHILGSAQIRVEDDDGQIWVATGDYKRAPDPSCTPFEVVRCNTLITEGTFSDPVYRWQEPHLIVQNLWNWWLQCAAENRAAVVLCYSLGKAQRILAELHQFSEQIALLPAWGPLFGEVEAAAQGPVWLHDSMTELTDAYRDAGVKLLPYRRLSEARKGHRFSGQLILTPPSARPSRRFGPKASTAFASGWMQPGSERFRRRPFGFALSDHADWPGLVQTIQESGASQVWIIHGEGEKLVAHLRNELNINAGVMKESPAPGY